jgi:hypothetical protein
MKRTGDMKRFAPNKHKEKPKLTVKDCLWCEKPIDPERKTAYAYGRIKTHKECAPYYRFYKMAKSQVPIPEDKYCPQCGALIVQREDEPDLHFVIRSYCNKVCSAKWCNDNRAKQKPKVKLPSIEERSGVKRYVPGSPEFQAIASLYL